MKHFPELTARNWAKRVNRTWIVHGGLADHAEAWLVHLDELDDGRLDQVCSIAKRMCDLRDPMDDPKPWFYAGLFSLATKQEARRFLEKHRVTKATIRSMADDEEVVQWTLRVGEETLELLGRLIKAVRSCVEENHP